MLQNIRTSVTSWISDPFDRADHPWITIRKPVKWGCTVCWGLIWVFCVVFLIIWAAGPVAVTPKTTSTEEAHPNGIENYYGIMWWGKNDVLYPIVNNVTGLGMGPSVHFDPTKPTLIYSHGYQPGSGPKAHRERLTSFKGVLMADAWIDQGWNVGSFYWTQFADEPTVEEAENKIWPNCLPITGVCDAPTMRWMKKDGSFFNPPPGSIPSVSDLMAESIVASTVGAQPDKGFKLRIAGHSLGGGGCHRCRVQACRRCRFRTDTQSLEARENQYARSFLDSRARPRRDASFVPHTPCAQRDHRNVTHLGILRSRELSRADAARSKVVLVGRLCVAGCKIYFRRLRSADGRRSGRRQA